MASKPSPRVHDQAEHCDCCDRETRHEINIEIRVESDEPVNARFSREPYRIATCTSCGTERAQRMNNV